MTRSPYLSRLFPGLLLLTLLSAAVFSAQPAHAAFIAAVAGPDVIANNGICTLREAIINANNNNQSGSTDCPAGQADTTDLITLVSGETYTLTIPGDSIYNEDSNAAEGDLDIINNAATLDILIASTNTGRATIAFEQPNNKYPSSRVLDVRSGASVSLLRVKVTGGDGGNFPGGGIQNNGTLRIDDSEIAKNGVSAGVSLGGGGIYTGPGSSLSIKNSTVYDNGSFTKGGGIYNNGGTVTIEASSVTDNRADNGGGIASNGSANNLAKLTITAGSTVSNNIAGDAPDDGGGGVWNGDASTTVIEQSIMENNRSRRNGGAIANLAGGTITIANSVLHNNQSGRIFDPNTVLSGSGGAVWNAGVVTVQTSTVYDNQAGKGANSNGGAFANYGELRIFNSAVYANQTQPGSGSNGGAIFNNLTLIVINSTLSGNSADGRGGAITTYGSADIRHATITANTATTAHGGLYLLGPSAQVEIKHSILAGNTAAGNPADCDNPSATLTSQGYNLVGSGCGSTFGPNTNDLVGADPKLAALADNDGATKTHALQTGSPALNAIPKAACADKDWPQLATDQRGITRPQDGKCEIGAYEQKALGLGVPNPTPVLTSLAPDNTPAGSDNVVLTVTGEKFVQGTLVRWNGSDRATTFVSATEVKATILKADLAAAGTAQVTVFNPAPAGGTSNALAFVITAPDKQNQAITFAPIADRTLVEGGFTLNATASSGLLVSYSASGACAIDAQDADKVTLLKPGTCLITAMQPGDATFNPAPDVLQSFKITGERVFVPLVVR